MGTGVAFGPRRTRGVVTAGLIGLCLGLAGCEDWQQAPDIVVRQPAAALPDDCVVSSTPPDDGTESAGPGLAWLRLDPCDPSLADASEAATIMFASSSIRLDAVARSTIEDLAAQLALEPGRSVAIIGHSDSLGPPEQNMAVSERRAEAVRDALVAAGLDPARIRVVQGRGETDPAVPTPDGTADRLNRRVEVLFL